MFTWIRNWVDFKIRGIDPEKEARALAEHKEMMRICALHYGGAPESLRALVRQSCEDQKEWIAKRNPGIHVEHRDWAMRPEEDMARKVNVVGEKLAKDLGADDDSRWTDVS